MSQPYDKKLFLGLLGLVLTVVLSSGAYAQSGSRSGSNKRDNNSAVKRQMERDRAKLRTKLASKIAKDEFGAIKLTVDQRKTLKGLVEEHFAALNGFDQQIGNAIPMKSQKALKRPYLMALKEGQSESQAMETSMMKAGLDETVRTRVMNINQSKQSLMDKIREGVVSVLDDEQKVALNKAMEAKKAMASEKEEMKKEASSES